MLKSNSYVRVVALDFSKAFDSVRHSTLVSKLACLDFPDSIFNWLVDFLDSRTHQTIFQGVKSTIKGISASVIQGSAIGPSAYAVLASDLHPVNKGNSLLKFADDTYLTNPECLNHTYHDELAHIELWSMVNNLKLNRNKTFEIIFHLPRQKSL